MKDRDLEWLVLQRSKVQKLLLEILKCLRSPRNQQDVPILQLLVGAAYSLWRAVFLADSCRNNDTVDEKAIAFLEVLIKDNAIAYAQESKNREWTGGYYLNNAYFRLDLTYKKLNLQTARRKKVTDFINQQARSDKKANPLQEDWITAYLASIEILKALSEKNP